MNDKSLTGKETQRPVEEIHGAIFFNNNPLPMWVYELETYRFLAVNDAAVKHYGYSEAEFKSMTIKDIRPAEDIDRLVQNVENLRGGMDEAGVWRHIKKDGSLIFVEIVSHTLEFGGRQAELVVAIDITERKLAERALEEREAQLLSIITSAMDAIIAIGEDHRIVIFNPAAEQMFKCPASEAIGAPLERFIPEYYRDQHREAVRAFGESLITRRTMKAPALALICLRADGEAFPSEVSISLTEFAGKKIYTAIVRDATERRQAEEQLRENEDRFRALIKNGRDNISLLSADGMLIWESPSVFSTLGYEPDKFVGRNLFELMHPDDHAWAKEQFERVVRIPGENGEGTFRLRHSEGRWIWIEATATNLLNEPSVKAIVVNYRDVSARKQVEDALKQSGERYRQTLDNMLEGCQIVDFDWRYVYINNSAARQGHSSREALLGRTMMEIYPGIETSETFSVLRDCMENRVTRQMENEFIYPDGSRGWFELGIQPVPEGIFILSLDITQRKEAEQQVNLQLQRLRALHDIDRAISSSIDMRVSLDILLGEVHSQLGVDAASILVLNPSTLMLEYVAGKGFHTSAIRQSHMHLGEGFAGQAGLERRVIHIPNLPESGENFQRAVFLKEEGFMEYFGVPLIAKGQLKGVLEIFNRAPLRSDPEWVNYMETLGGQAAIAIENAQMFEGLQHSHMELATAYDATIEGWSRAMDLRDKETEGHTLRVTELTMALAQRMGIQPQELIHIRRGALLHDIGKLGVPDHILLKPGKLTDEEWEIMRQHPIHALNMLQPIAYLRPALDIPYCHHEKWDGSGYPRGLKGEQIPLAARLFAIIDVWDALRSDRPYRPGWTTERTRQYILEQSGKHFDPAIVEIFQTLIKNE